MDELILIDSYMNYLINKQPNIEEGINILKSHIINNLKIEWLNNSIVMESYVEFEKWLNHTFETEPLPEGIIAFNFGIFKSKDGIQLYISGSSTWNKENSNWIYNNNYLPEGRYPYITVFEHITTIFEVNKWIAMYLALGICFLFVRTYALNNAENLLTSNTNSIYFSTGFNNENLYNIGKLTRDGFELI